MLSFAMIHNKPRATRITIAARMNNQVPVPRVLWFARTITELGWHEAWPAMCKEVQRQVKNCKAVGVFPPGRPFLAVAVRKSRRRRFCVTGIARPAARTSALMGENPSSIKRQGLKPRDAACSSPDPERERHGRRRLRASWKARHSMRLVAATPSRTTRAGQPRRRTSSSRASWERQSKRACTFGLMLYNKINLYDNKCARNLPTSC